MWEFRKCIKRIDQTGVPDMPVWCVFLRSINCWQFFRRCGSIVQFLLCLCRALCRWFDSERFDGSSSKICKGKESSEIRGRFVFEQRKRHLLTSVRSFLLPGQDTLCYHDQFYLHPSCLIERNCLHLWGSVLCWGIAEWGGDCRAIEDLREVPSGKSGEC